MFLQMLGVLFSSALLATPMLQETTMVPVLLDDQTVNLETRIYRPDGEGPFPTFVFNHGSAGNGRDPDVFAQPIDFPALSRFFVARGWVVVIPARRGRGTSEGIDDEGFAPDRSRGYSCDPARAIPGAERGLRDVEAAMSAILEM